MITDRPAVAPSADGQPPAPLHRAIDLLTGALLETQMLARRADEGTMPPDRLADDLRRLERTLHELGDCLLQVRDGEA